MFSENKEMVLLKTVKNQESFKISIRNVNGFRNRDQWLSTVVGSRIISEKCVCYDEYQLIKLSERIVDTSDMSNRQRPTSIHLFYKNTENSVDLA